jgi:hypothetical protein
MPGYFPKKSNAMSMVSHTPCATIGIARLRRYARYSSPRIKPSEPSSRIEPATGGCRNIVGVVNHDGTATIYAITSTISLNGDNGADPNKLVKVTDRISAVQPATNGYLDTLVTIRSARAGEAFRGVALAPQDNNDQHQQ